MVIKHAPVVGWVVEKNVRHFKQDLEFRQTTLALVIYDHLIDQCEAILFFYPEIKVSTLVDITTNRKNYLLAEIQHFLAKGDERGADLMQKELEAIKVVFLLLKDYGIC